MKISVDDLWDISAKKLIRDLSNGSYSIFERVTGKKLPLRVRRKAFLLRSTFNLIWFFYRGKTDNNFRNNRRLAYKIARFMFSIAPASFRGIIPVTADSLIVEYNSQSVGDVFRLVAYCLENYCSRQKMFVIDLMSYELIAPILLKLKQLGIFFTPIMTEDNYYVLNVDGYKNPLLYDLRNKLYDHFVDSCDAFTSCHSIIWVPFDISNQKKLFVSKDEFDGDTPIKSSTMSDIAFVALRNESIGINVCIMATCVLPEGIYGKGINTSLKYKISFGEIYDETMIKRLLVYEFSNKHKLDYEVLRSISRSMFSLNAYDLVY